MKSLIAKFLARYMTKNFLTKFLAHNFMMLAKASSHHQEPHYQNAAWLRAAIPPRSNAVDHGWIGGHPNLPDPFKWPGRDGQPYQFLCQINCASLPPELWGGLGPRSGWLAIFAARTDQIDVKVIYAPALGSDRHNDNAWSKAASTLRHLDDRFDQFLGPPAKWQLTFVHPAQDGTCVPNRMRQSASADEAFRVAAPENQPSDWTMLELLLTEGFNAATEQEARFFETLREREAGLQPPSEDLTNTLNEMIETSDQLLAALQACDTSQAFSLTTWLAQASLIGRINLLRVKFLLQEGNSFNAIVSKLDIDLLNNQGLLRTRSAPSPLFLPQSAQGRAHADLMRLVTDLERDLKADALIPPPPVNRYSPNTAPWRQYRENCPQDWQSYASRVIKIRTLYQAFLLENAMTIAPMAKDRPQVSLPETLEKALKHAELERKWAADRLAKFQNMNLDEEIKQIDVARQKHSDCKTLTARLAGAIEKLHGRRPDAIFNPDDWIDVYQGLDESQARETLRRYWNYNYKRLRSEAAKRLYSVDPENISPVARPSLESDWTFHAEQATLQMGGIPRGWCARFIAGKPESVMLLQIPTNNLTNFIFGDVDDLVISITRQNLKKRKFGQAFVDISN